MDEVGEGGAGCSGAFSSPLAHHRWTKRGAADHAVAFDVDNVRGCGSGVRRRRDEVTLLDLRALELCARLVRAVQVAAVGRSHLHLRGESSPRDSPPTSLRMAAMGLCMCGRLLEDRQDEVEGGARVVPHHVLARLARQHQHCRVLGGGRGVWSLAVRRVDHVLIEEGARVDRRRLR